MKGKIIICFLVVLMLVSVPMVTASEQQTSIKSYFFEKVQSSINGNENALLWLTILCCFVYWIILIGYYSLS